MNISFTKSAREKIKDYIKNQESAEEQFLRISVPGSQNGQYTYQFFLDEASKFGATDIVSETDGFKLVVDEKHVSKIDGALVDWVDSVSGSGFKVDAPKKSTVNYDSPVEDRIRNLFEDEINVSLASHGGRVELLEVRGTQAILKLSGGCQGCASSTATLKQGIEVRIREVAPEIHEVIDATDHASGTNPYFS